MNKKAKTALPLPQSSKSGAYANSIQFIIAIIIICIEAFK
jgi:hypothetical protein